MRQSTRFLTVQGQLRWLSALAALAFTACSNLPAHNNTLIFGTATDFGLGLSTPSATDSSISVNIGYKERRAAWVPLWANAKTGGSGEITARDCVDKIVKAEGKEEHTESDCKKRSKFVATSKDGADENDQAGTAYDAYSTFASFGGSVAASGNATGAASASGSLTLASFFATGVAAQNLAKQGTGLVSAGPNGAKADTNEPSTAVQNAQIELQKFFELTADKNSKGDETYKRCLSKLSKNFDAAEPKRFEWLAKRKPANASALLVSNYMALGDDKFRELDGVAFQLSKKFNETFDQRLSVLRAENEKKPSKDSDEALKLKAFTEARNVECGVD